MVERSRNKSRWWSSAWVGRRGRKGGREDPSSAHQLAGGRAGEVVFVGGLSHRIF